ncbi:MAG: hypothetical protein JSW27_21120 [Phycisphaerales bacterium]|nr:MAG: hypothetical protein JSW27_21120 [Phycisphaerales bacterium]
MINNIDRNQLGHIVGQSSLPNADPAAARPVNDADASLQVRFGDLINLAQQPAQADTDVVREARKLLDTGQLTCRENITSAARNILNFGV